MFRCNAPLPDVIRKIVIRKVDDIRQCNAFRVVVFVVLTFSCNLFLAPLLLGGRMRPQALCGAWCWTRRERSLRTRTLWPYG